MENRIGSNLCVQVAVRVEEVIELGVASALTLGGTGPGCEAFAGRPGPRITNC